MDSEMQDMMKAGVHYGHRTSRTHPKMRPYIVGVKNGIEIIDLETTKNQLEKAIAFLKGLSKDAVVLFVGTLPHSQAVVREIAEGAGYPSVTERWLGGLLTNFKMISGRIRNMIDLKTKKQAGEFEKYTKKERQRIDQEIGRSERVFSGYDTLTRIPDALVVVGVNSHETAIHEARLKNIPVIALVDSDADPSLVEYPIVANDNARSSIRFVLTKLVEALKGGENTQDSI